MTNKICVITPTGDRPEALNLSYQYLYRQTFKDIEWLVIDDGNIPHFIDDCKIKYKYINRQSNTNVLKNTLRENIICALSNLPDCTHIAIWEDDDWYSPFRLERQLSLMEVNDYILHGYKHTIYYNIKYKNWYQFHNKTHASFFETMMSKDMALQYRDILINENPNMFEDTALWKYFGEQGALTDNEGLCIGIKGMPGRNGIGTGHTFHNEYFNDEYGLKLVELIDIEDAGKYINCIGVNI